MVEKAIVEYVAQLARIDISEEEKEFLKTQLSHILEYIGKLKELKVEGIQPMSGVHLAHNVVRDDIVNKSGAEKDIIRNAPSREGNYFKVPKVIE